MATPIFKLVVDNRELTLIEFDGHEEMNRLFKFVFTCEEQESIKLIDLINAESTFTIKEFEKSIYSGNLDIPGYISQVSKSNGNWLLEFSPKLKKTDTNSRSEIYFKEDCSLTANTILDEEFNRDIYLEDRGFINNVIDTIPNRKIFCQYNESNFNFVARLCDHWGFQFYFDHFAENIVFSDNTQYDQEIESVFKTKKNVSRNNLLRLDCWTENLKNPTSYINIIGHDYLNAGSKIESRYPLSDNNDLTQSTYAISDVSSQIEAEYLARIKYESNNCLNHKAFGISNIPYLFPGFLIATDDSDFSSALVYKTIHKARNLNSLSNVEAASYECHIELIPADVCFRPQPFYDIPQASSVIGKTISDSVDSDLAQRNEDGKYKVKLIGFENESEISSDPWVRKAQVSAGSNSVDIPLTPNTEVLLAFVDNNPNCPYIQHALDNSLHPVPVTHANAHHAVISTDGMLVTSSLQGRYNLATTRSHERAGDMIISSSIKNYFVGRGDFDQNNNFIDPSDSTAPAFTPDDRASGNYITKQFYGDQIQISQGDRLHWHAGNLYDFGGYSKYNIDKRYEENFIDEEAPLNIKVAKDSRTGDILQNNGPDWGSISFSEIQKNGLAANDVTPDSHGNTAINTDRAGKTFKVNTGGAWNATGMKVSKNYNASYDYKFGESINISDRVNSLEITHTDADTTLIAMNFHGGNLRSWEKTKNRGKKSKSWNSSGELTAESESRMEGNNPVSEETNWHTHTDRSGRTKSSYSKTTKRGAGIETDAKTYNLNTGALATHNNKVSDGMGTAEMDFSFASAATSKFNFGTSTAFSLSAQADSSIAISLSGSAKISIGFGAAVEVKTGAEASLAVDARLGVSAKVNSKGKVSVSAIGFKAEAESRASANAKAIELAQVISTIADYGCKIDNTKAKITSGGLDISSSFTKIFL